MKIEEIITFIQTWDYIIIPVLIVLCSVAAYYVIRNTYRQFLNRLWVRIFISPKNVVIKKASMLDKKYKLKGDDTDATYIIDHDAVINEVGFWSVKRFIEFKQGIELPLRRKFLEKTETSEYIGSDTLTALLDHKAFVEVAMLGEGGSLSKNQILMIIGVLILIGIGYFGYTQGWFGDVMPK